MIAVVLLAVATLLPRCYPPPVVAPISVPFVRPACQYCPGHRGVEFQVERGTVVTAVAAGVVTFSGAVAGTRYVVVLQPDGLRATYGMLATASLNRGDVVRRGMPVGTAGDHVYFGLRSATDAPIDPTPLLGWLAGRPRLVPAGSSTPRPAPPPRLVCPPGIPPPAAG